MLSVHSAAGQKPPIGSSIHILRFVRVYMLKQQLVRRYVRVMAFSIVFQKTSPEQRVGSYNRDPTQETSVHHSKKFLKPAQQKKGEPTRLPAPCPLPTGFTTLKDSKEKDIPEKVPYQFLAKIGHPLV